MEDAIATTRGALLGGRVVFAQPARGYRAAIDPVFLAAAMTLAEGRVLELGAGAGAASLCLAWRCPHLAIVALEIDPDLAALLRRNAEANGFAARLEVRIGDVATLEPALFGGFDLVFCNPPYEPVAQASPSPHPDKRRAHVEPAGGLADWIAAARRALRARGRLLMIHRADRLHEILTVLAPGFGDIEILPLWPGGGRPARRVVLRARLGARGGTVLRPGLTLHGPDGRFTAAAERILRDGAALDAALGDAVEACPGGDADA